MHAWDTPRPLQIDSYSKIVSLGIEGGSGVIVGCAEPAVTLQSR